ncbi:hypothetical protein [Mameliella sediminis]|uniref:hypothetical protein n=1 Tax=Mameliella sediminis TaxID=2836866 RepID=UPI001C4373DF|nr:hypothetical protein [Mameliella sediminis]MBY6115209.1 hypothetical protein [Antarctobacter heliothermus]MBY6144906.1 hypothetical protein [Mameliella alba]MBV7396021.1 hypothetical protein [Mameliella sediminis]MBY6160432.1 hypothetical protein [Mameliella alba]MBY6168902.1 hypothetical protein [Mameliella alba]
MKQSAFDVQHPFFLPLWRRVATVALCLGWAGLELSWGNPLWAILFAAIGTYCAHQFFVAWDAQAVRKKQEDQGGDP